MTSFPEDSRFSEETTGSSDNSSHKRAEISPSHWHWLIPFTFYLHVQPWLTLKPLGWLVSLLFSPFWCWNWKAQLWSIAAFLLELMDFLITGLRFHIKRALTGAVFKSNVATTAPSNLQMWQLLDKTIGHEQGDDSLGGGGFLHWRNLSVLLLFVHFLFFFFAFSHSSTSLSSLGGGGSLCTTTSSPTDSTGETINNHFVCGALVCLAASDAPPGWRIFWYAQKAQWIID